MASRRFSLGLIGVIVVAAAVSFVQAQKLKQLPASVGRPVIPKALSVTCRPGPRCLPGHVARMSFLLRTPSRLRLQMVNTAGEVVANLPVAPGVLAKGRVSAVWNGRTAAGARAPDGHYHLRVTLLPGGRTYTLPQVLALENTPPMLTLTAPAGRLPLHYRVSQVATVYAAFRPLGGGTTTILRGLRGVIAPGPGRLPAGRYRVSMMALDTAGNLSRVLRAGIVTVKG